MNPRLDLPQTQSRNQKRDEEEKEAFLCKSYSPHYLVPAPEPLDTQQNKEKRAIDWKREWLKVVELSRSQDETNRMVIPLHH